MSVPAVAQSNYTWQNAELGGTGYVTGIIAHPCRQGLFHARTGVGGAYRNNSATEVWIPLNDWTPTDNPNLFRIDAIAINPNDASKLYMVAGVESPGL